MIVVYDTTIEGDAAGPRHNPAYARLVMRLADLHEQDRRATPQGSACTECGSKNVWVGVKFDYVNDRWTPTIPSWCDDCEERMRAVGRAQSVVSGTIETILRGLQDEGIIGHTSEIDGADLKRVIMDFLTGDEGPDVLRRK